MIGCDSGYCVFLLGRLSLEVWFGGWFPIMKPYWCQGRNRKKSYWHAGFCFFGKGATVRWYDRGYRYNGS